MKDVNIIIYALNETKKIIKTPFGALIIKHFDDEYRVW